MSLIRETLLRGVREVSAFAFTPETPTEVVLAEWATGAVLERLDDAGMVLRLPRPISVRCEVGRGVPLMEVDGRLVALPLDVSTWSRYGGSISSSWMKRTWPSVSSAVMRTTDQRGRWSRA